MSIKAANINAVVNNSEDNNEIIEKTDMSKVNYFLSRPSLLMDQLPKGRRAELAEHVGRRAVNVRGLANPRLNRSR